MQLNKVNYKDLNARQKENYNYHKVASALADCGYDCMRLNNDWQGADFIAVHNDGKEMLKIQLKGRFTIDKKYQNKIFNKQNLVFSFSFKLIQICRTTRQIVSS